MTKNTFLRSANALKMECERENNFNYSIHSFVLDFNRFYTCILYVTKTSEPHCAKPFVFHCAVISFGLILARAWTASLVHIALNTTFGNCFFVVVVLGLSYSLFRVPFANMAALTSTNDCAPGFQL